MFASDCTKAIGMMKKKVRKKKATAIRSFRIVNETYGIARFFQYTSRGSGAHSVNHRVGFRACCVWAQTAAPQRVLNDTKAAGMIALGLFTTSSFSSAICKFYKTFIKYVSDEIKSKLHFFFVMDYICFFLSLVIMVLICGCNFFGPCFE